jgi:hypothetical protein
MGDFRSVNQEIDKLESMIPGGFFSSNKPDWKSIWSQIRVVGSSFKGAKYPSREEHQQAWDKYQKLINEVKRIQGDEQDKWNSKKSESARLRDRIISQARSAKPSSGIGDVILCIATGGVSMLLDAIMGPFDDRKRELQSASEQLRKGWDMLNEYKDSMLGRDKHDAFQALNEAKEYLDQKWDDYKRERQSAFDKYQRERDEKQQAWRDRMEENINKLEDRRDRLNSVLSHKESHLDDLRDKLRDAWSDDYRARVSDWISEEESNIEDIRNKLSNVEDWLYEARSKLRS